MKHSYTTIENTPPPPLFINVPSHSDKLQNVNMIGQSNAVGKTDLNNKKKVLTHSQADYLDKIL